jgi:hypothetical protein
MRYRSKIEEDEIKWIQITTRWIGKEDDMNAGDGDDEIGRRYR